MQLCGFLRLTSFTYQYTLKSNFYLCVSLVAQSCPPLCDPMDYSPPVSSVRGIFRAWILEWVAISVSRYYWIGVYYVAISKCVYLFTQRRTIAIYLIFFFFKWNVFWLLFSLSKLYFGKGNENPLQYSCLGNPTDRRAWQVTVRGVAKESDVTEGLNNKPASCLQLYEDSEFQKWVSNVRYSSPNFSLVYENACLVSQSCPTLQDALDCSLQGSPVRRIFQVRVLAWAVISLLQGVFPT